MSPSPRIPFTKPVYLGAEHDRALCEVARSPQLAGNGAWGKRCEQLLEDGLGKPTRLVTSATHAMEIMALLLDLGPNDEVILPSFTFVSTANAFALRGAKLCFADNGLDGNLRIDDVERKITPRTRAIVTVDYGGGSADLQLLRALCDDRKIALLEDAAQGIHATYRGRALGTMADLACLSFHDTKNVTAGEGGALVVGDPRFLERADVIREKGTNRTKFFQGLVDKYSWVDIGSSYVLSELNAAYLEPQLLKLQEIQARRRSLWETYARELRSDLERVGARIFETPDYNESNHHVFAVLFSSQEARDRFIAGMREQGIACPFHYLPLHRSAFGARYWDSSQPLPGAEKISATISRIPLFHNLTDAEQAYVIDQVRTWLRG